MARPAENKRHADPSLVEHAFSTAKGRVIGDASAHDPQAFIAAHTPVITGEDHERVLVQSQLFERGQYPSHALVHAGDQRRVDGAVMTAGRGFSFKTLDELGFRLMGGMDGKMVKAEEKWLLGMAANKIHGLVRQEVCQISAFRIGNRRIRREIEMPSRRSNGFVKTAGPGVVLRVLSQMPLSEQARDISGTLEGLRQRDFFQRQFLHVIDGAERSGSPRKPFDAAHRVHPRSGSILPTNQGGSCRLTVRTRRVTIGEFHALGGHAVDVGRLVVFASVTGQIRVAEVVREDEDEIGAIPHSGCRFSSPNVVDTTPNCGDNRSDGGKDEHPSAGYNGIAMTHLCILLNCGYFWPP